MVRLMNPWASVRFVSILAVGGLALSGCATTKYVDEQIASVNGRVDAVDAKATDAIQRADAANSTAQACFALCACLTKCSTGCRGCTAH